MKLSTLVCTLLVSFGTATCVRADLGDNAALGYWQAFAQLPQFDEKDREVLLQWQKTDLENDHVQELLKGSESAVKLLVAAAKEKDCNWGLDKSQGALLLLPHLSKSRDIARIAMLHARAKLVAGKSDQAIADLSATTKLAKDCGQPPLLVSTLVELSIKRGVQDWISDSAERLSGQQRAALLSEFDQMFPPARLSVSMAAEADFILTWLKTEVDNPTFLAGVGVGEDAEFPKGELFRPFMEKQLVLLEEDYQEMIDAADGDLSLVKQTEKKLIDRARSENRLLSSLLLPALVSARAALDRSNAHAQKVRESLLRLQGESVEAGAADETEQN